MKERGGGWPLPRTDLKLPSKTAKYCLIQWSCEEAMKSKSGSGSSERVKQNTLGPGSVGPYAPEAAAQDGLASALPAAALSSFSNLKGVLAATIQLPRIQELLGLARI